MSLTWTLLGTCGQLLLAYFLFMVAVFVGGGIVNGRTLGKAQSGILNQSMFALPGLSILSASIVIVLHLRAGSATAYWWYVLPLAGTALYLAYAVRLGQRT